MDKKKNFAAAVVMAAGLGVLSGCATTGQYADERDPFEGFNRNVQVFNDKLDQYALKPVAEGYQWVTPDFVDKGVSNFFSNLDDVIVTLNDLLQFKFGQAAEDGSRFVINTTLGIAGLFDVATGFGFEKNNEDFDQTLGAWGVPTGPYLVLPFFGPSSPRGVVGLAGDFVSDPISYASGWDARLALRTTEVVDFRADNLSTSEVIDEAALDEYEFIRDSYFQRREYLVYDGNPPEDEEMFFEEEEAK